MSLHLTNQSKRHHYIPQFYLKGFCDATGRMHVFDKEKGTFIYRTPETIFYQHKRNTTALFGVEHDMLEQAYSLFDSINTDLIEKLRSSVDVNPFHGNPQLAVNFWLFITQLMWRIPSSDEALHTQIPEFDFQKLGLVLVNKQTGEKTVNPSLEALFRNEETFTEFARLIIPSTKEYKALFHTTDPNKWNILYQDDGKHLIGDVPFIINSPSRNILDIPKGFYVPLSSDKTIIYLDPPPIEYPKMKTLALDVALFHSAERFVGGRDLEYLEAVKFLSDTYKGLEVEDFIIPTLFKD
ncbi:MAG TPA: DUF4238 domain-containing protein [Saprospiraceae bacterium]|nr:DUF4238 domain-containing protein [Saprospiraceae bacterium]